MAKYSQGDAARDTNASKGEVSSAWHSARDDAFGSRDGGGRNYSSGDRGSHDSGLQSQIESERGLGGSSSGGGSRGSGGGSGK